MDDGEKSQNYRSVYTYNGLTLRCLGEEAVGGYAHGDEYLTCWTLRFVVAKSQLTGAMAINALTYDKDFADFVKRRLLRSGRLLRRQFFRREGEFNDWTVRSQCHFQHDLPKFRGQVYFEWGFWAVPAGAEEIAREEIRLLKEGIV